MRIYWFEIKDRPKNPLLQPLSVEWEQLNPIPASPKLLSFTLILVWSPIQAVLTTAKCQW